MIFRLNFIEIYRKIIHKSHWGSCSSLNCTIAPEQGSLVLGMEGSKSKRDSTSSSIART